MDFLEDTKSRSHKGVRIKYPLFRVPIRESTFWILPGVWVEKVLERLGVGYSQVFIEVLASSCRTLIGVRKRALSLQAEVLS